jgi:hypothetical protein
VAAARRPVCGDECLERLLACHALKTPGAQDFVRSLGQNLAARRLPVIVGAGRSGVSLAFETGDEVDDIRCGLADGTALLLQAKRPPWRPTRQCCPGG